MKRKNPARAEVSAVDRWVSRRPQQCLSVLNRLHANPSVPEKYLKGLTGRERQKRIQEIESRKKEVSGPLKFRDFTTDKGKKTKPSGYTQTYKATIGKGGSVAQVSRETGISKSILSKVYARGLAAWATGHRPGASQHAWALARVYSFATRGKTFHTADADLALRAGLSSGRSSGYKQSAKSLEKDLLR